MRRSSFKRPTIERRPVVLTPIPVEQRRGVMAPVTGGTAAPKAITYRNQGHLKALRGLACVDCGAKDGTVVAAHMNAGKGMAIKASDAATAALCFRCHSRLDQGGQMPRAERRAYEWEMVARTYIALMEGGRLG